MTRRDANSGGAAWEKEKVAGRLWWNVCEATYGSCVCTCLVIWLPGPGEIGCLVGHGGGPPCGVLARAHGRVLQVLGGKES